MHSEHAGYDSEQEKRSTKGCAPTDTDVLRIMKFLTALLAFRKKLQMHNQGQDFPDPLSTFFENILTNAALTYTLESLDKYHDSLCKALQLVEAPKKSKSTEGGASKTANVELEAKVWLFAECILFQINSMQTVLHVNGMLFCGFVAGDFVGACSCIHPVPGG